MKAKFINENIEFKRGKKSKDSLSLGQRYSVKINDLISWKFKNFNGLNDFDDYNEGLAKSITEKGPEVFYYHKGQGRMKMDVIPFNEIISINGDKLTESIDFKRGQSSKDALGVGSFAVKVVNELRKLDKYIDKEIRISHDAKEIFIEGKNLTYNVELSKYGESHIYLIDVKQHILFDGDNFDVEFSTTINLRGQDSAEEENWEMDKPHTAEEVAENAEINYQNAEFNFDEERIKEAFIQREEGLSESTQFKRTGDSKNTLGIGHKWRILLHENSYPYAEEEFIGTIGEAQKFAAKKLVGGWDYATYRKGKKEDFWATFSEWKDKYRKNGQYYKDAEGNHKQRDEWEGGWDEIFDYRIRLKNIDVTELRFNDKLVINDSKDRN